MDLFVSEVERCLDHSGVMWYSSSTVWQIAAVGIILYSSQKRPAGWGAVPCKCAQCRLLGYLHNSDNIYMQILCFLRSCIWEIISAYYFWKDGVYEQKLYTHTVPFVYTHFLLLVECHLLTACKCKMNCDWSINCTHSLLYCRQLMTFPYL